MFVIHGKGVILRLLYRAIDLSKLTYLNVFNICVTCGPLTFIHSFFLLKTTSGFLVLSRHLPQFGGVGEGKVANPGGSKGPEGRTAYEGGRDSERRKKVGSVEIRRE